MAIRRWQATELSDVIGELERMQNEMDRVFGYQADLETRGLFDENLAPAVDVIETKDDYVVYADIPGVDGKDLDVSIAGTVLTIKGEKRSAGEKDRRKIFRRETWSGTFQRTLSLPESVDPDKVEARLSEGVLRLSIAKRPELKPRQIAIKAK